MLQICCAGLFCRQAGSACCAPLTSVMSLAAKQLNSEVRELHWSHLVEKALVQLHDSVASIRRARQQKSLMGIGVELAPAGKRMGTEHAGAGSHAAGSILGHMPQAEFLGPDGHGETRPQSEDSTQMPQAQFVGPQEPGVAMGPGTVPMPPPMSGSTASGPDDPIVCLGCRKPVQIRTHSETKETFLACAQFPGCATPLTPATWPDLPTCRGCGKHTVMRVQNETQMVFLGCSQYPTCRATTTYPPSTQPDLPRCRLCSRHTFLWVNRRTQLPFIGCKEHTTCSGVHLRGPQLRQ